VTLPEKIADARYRVARLHQVIVEAQETRERLATWPETAIIPADEARAFLHMIEQRARADAEVLEAALYWVQDFPPAA
jgi:hypothetical protein